MRLPRDDRFNSPASATLPFPGARWRSERSDHYPRRDRRRPESTRNQTVWRRVPSWSSLRSPAGAPMRRLCRWTRQCWSGAWRAFSLAPQANARSRGHAPDRLPGSSPTRPPITSGADQWAQSTRRATYVPIARAVLPPQRMRARGWLRRPDTNPLTPPAGVGGSRRGGPDPSRSPGHPTITEGPPHLGLRDAEATADLSGGELLLG
jgi:hypothetical protein